VGPDYAPIIPPRWARFARRLPGDKKCKPLLDKTEGVLARDRDLTLPERFPDARAFPFRTPPVNEITGTVMIPASVEKPMQPDRRKPGGRTMLYTIGFRVSASSTRTLPQCLLSEDALSSNALLRSEASPTTHASRGTSSNALPLTLFFLRYSRASK